MGERRLASTVYVDGKPYARNTTAADLPDEVVDHLADNAAAWTDADDPDDEVAAGQGMTALGSVGQPVGAGADGRTMAELGLGGDAGDGQAVKPPPMTGTGSGAGAWRDYAAQVGVDVPADASRDDVVAALQSAGKPTRE